MNDKTKVWPYNIYFLDDDGEQVFIKEELFIKDKVFKTTKNIDKATEFDTYPVTNMMLAIERRAHYVNLHPLFILNES